MSSSSGTFALSDLLSLSYEGNPNQTHAPGCLSLSSYDDNPNQTHAPGCLSLSSYDDNPNQTHPNQDISRIGEQNVDNEMVGLDMGKSSHDKQNVDKEMVGLDIGKPSHNKQNVDKEMVGLDISQSSRNKPKKRRSDVWKMFEKCKDENGKDLAKCNLCEKLFDGSSKKGTTHLRNHFRSCQNKRNGGGASGSGDKPAGNSVTDQQLNHLNWVRTWIKYGCWDLPEQVGDDDIILVYNEEKEKLRKYFEKLCCGLSLTIANVEDGEYTGFVVHFIDDDWKLKEKMIGLKCIEGDQNMKVLKNVLLDLGIDNNNISSIVTKGGSDKYVPSSDERENRLSGQGSLLSNCKFCLKDFYDVYGACTDFEKEMRWVQHDHMRKIFNYIIEPSSKIGTFQMALGKEVIGKFQMALGKEVTITEEMLEDMFWLDLVKIALGLKEAFFELENMDLHFKSINLTKEQWDVVTKFVQFYDEDDEIDWDLLERKTANIYFPILCRMYKKSCVFVASLNSFNCGKINLQFVRDAEKCWEQSNLILAVAAVLDPRFKLDTVEHWYKKIYGDECETQRATFMNYLISVYNKYANGTNNFQSSTSGSKKKKSSISYKMLDISRNSYDPDSGQSNNFELDLYLEHVNFPPIEEFDILEWWRGNSWYFPTLAKMARDFLSIRITIPYVYSEIFYYQESFDSNIVKEAAVCARSWLKNEESDEESE